MKGKERGQEVEGIDPARFVLIQVMVFRLRSTLRLAWVERSRNPRTNATSLVAELVR
jgi:hypothetical protein